MNCEHTTTDSYGAVLRCVSKSTEQLSIQETNKRLQETLIYYYCNKHYFVHNLSAVKKNLVKAKDVLPGDIFTGRNGPLRVLDVSITSRAVELLLAEGRNDPGEWSELVDPNEELHISRQERP